MYGWNNYGNKENILELNNQLNFTPGSCISAIMDNMFLFVSGKNDFIDNDEPNVTEIDPLLDDREKLPIKQLL